ncbi:MAG: hypothetical protein WCR54_01780 [Clostridia bacterium]
MIDIINPNEGIIKSYTIATTQSNPIFYNDDNKRNYIASLIECENESVCLIAYCVTNDRVYLLAKGMTKKDTDNYIKAVDRFFYNNYLTQSGFPFAPVVNNKKVTNKNLIGTIDAIHNKSLTAPENYEFCSYLYLIDGCTDAVAIVQTAKNIYTLNDYESLLQSSVDCKIKEMAGKENFDIVMAQDNARYIIPNKYTEESNIIFVIADVCIRTNKSYYFVMKKMGINSKKRRDILIGVICNIIVRNEYSVQSAIAVLKLKKESLTSLVLEVIAEFNRVYKYSYDYITNLLGISDVNYNLLVELIKGLNAQFGDSFETICVKFHLQKDLIPIRNRCGL